MIKTGNKEPSKSASWKVLETVMSHLKESVAESSGTPWFFKRLFTKTFQCQPTSFVLFVFTGLYANQMDCT